MNETVVTLAGNAVADPVMTATSTGAFVTKLRVASTSRRFDRDSQTWVDAGTIFVTASCWRQLAENVSASVRRGDPVIVTGRLVQRSYDDREGIRRTVFEIEATAVGLDLNRGTTLLSKVNRPAPAATNSADTTARGEGITTGESPEPVDPARPVDSEIPDEDTWSRGFAGDPFGETSPAADTEPSPERAGVG